MKEKNFGTVTLLPSDRWRARYRHDGRQITLGVYDEEIQAWEALEAVEVDIRRGDHFDGTLGRTRFKDFMKVYMQFRKTRVAATTFKNDEGYLRVHLIPFFGQRQLRTVGVKDIDEWWVSMPVTVTRKNSYFLMKKALDYATRWGYLRTNPCLVEEPGKDVSRARPTFTVADFRDVLVLVPARWQAPLEVLFAGHLRLGELIGLDASDYNRKTGVISVTKQVTALGHLTATKTGQRKKIRLLATGVVAMEQVPPKIGATPLFVGSRGGRIRRATIRAEWNEAVRAAGLEDFHLHDLRHVGLSLVAQSGAPLKDIMVRGGHISQAAAMRYQHSDSARDVAVALATDALLALA